MSSSMPPAPQIATRNQSDAAYVHGSRASVEVNQPAFTSTDGHKNPVVPTHI